MTEHHNKKKSKIIEYFEESFQELKKVTWPTKNQAVRLTLLVLGFCIASAVVIGVMDALFSYGHQRLVDYAATVAPVEETVNDTTDAQLPVTTEAPPLTPEAPLTVTPTAATTSTQQ
jgi:preprotein translocase subunit SecE